MLPVRFCVVQPLLSFVGIQGHLPVDIHVKCMILNTIQGKPARPVIERRRNGAQQPVLQDSNAADATLVEIQPVIGDPAFRRTFERHTPQEFEERSLERNAINFPFQLVTGKMDRQAASPDLPIKFPNIEQIVGSHENVQNPGLTQGGDALRPERSHGPRVDTVLLVLPL